MRTGNFGGCLFLGVLAPAVLACTQAKSPAGTGGDGGVDAGITGITATLAGDLNDPVEMSLQNGTLYWASFVGPGGAILSVPTAGGATPTVVQTGRNNPYSVTTDATILYWIDYGTYDSTGVYNNDGAVLQAPLAAGSQVTTLASDRAGPNALAVSGDTIYWVDIGLPDSDDPANYSSGLVLSEPVGGGAISTLYSLSPPQSYLNAIAADAQHVYWAIAGSFNSSGAYNQDGAVIQANPDGSNVITLASGQYFPTALTVDANDVYWTNSGQYDTMGDLLANTGYIAKAPIGGGTVTTLAGYQDAPVSIAVDAVHTVWVNGGVDSDDGSVVFIPIGGGMPATVAAGQTNPVGLSVSSDDGHIYWTEAGTSGADGGMPGSVLSFTRQ